MNRLYRYFVRSALLPLFIVLFCTGRAHTSTVRALSLEGLVSHADIVVYGSARSVETHRGEHGRIVRSFEVEVRDYLVGSGPSQIQVRLAGGSLNGRGRLVPGEAELLLNEGAVLFLERVAGTSEPLFYVVGMAQGRFEVVGDPAAGSARVTRTLGDLNLVGDVDDRVMGLGRANTSTFIPYEDFVAEIKRLAKSAAQGEDD